MENKKTEEQALFKKRFKDEFLKKTKTTLDDVKFYESYGLDERLKEDENLKDFIIGAFSDTDNDFLMFLAATELFEIAIGKTADMIYDDFLQKVKGVAKNEVA